MSFSDVATARQGAELGVERSRNVVAPTVLREALAELNVQNFGVGVLPRGVTPGAIGMRQSLLHANKPCRPVGAVKLCMARRGGHTW